MFWIDWENKVSTQGIHYSRYVASFNKELIRYISTGGTFNRFAYGDYLMDWLKESCELSEEEAEDIFDMATNGKLELEGSAHEYIRTRLLTEGS